MPGNYSNNTPFTYKIKNGKHYKRRCLTLMYEALMRRVIRRELSDGRELLPELKEKIEALRNPSARSQEEMQATSTDVQVDAEFTFCITSVFENIEESDSPMAKFWLSFMEMVEILMMNMHPSE